MDDTKTLVELMENIHTGLILIDSKWLIEEQIEINADVEVLISKEDKS